MEDSEIMDWIGERIREYAATKHGLVISPAQDSDKGNQWAVRSMSVSRNQSILGELKIIFEKTMKRTHYLPAMLWVRRSESGYSREVTRLPSETETLTMRG